jgi:hypothetical protein
MAHDVVFLLDVDNTLLDNDRVADDLRAHLTGNFGKAGERYWAHFEEIRKELGYADYLGALQRYRADLEGNGEAAHRLLSVSQFLIDYPFADRLYPDALEVLEKLAKTGPTVILSDGDVVFQPRKVQRSGIWKAVDGRVLIFIHKEEMLATVEREYPAKRYVLIDDKERILDAVKAIWGEKLVTVFPRQGHYAHDPANVGKYRKPDVTVERIGDLLAMDIAEMVAG